MIAPNGARRSQIDHPELPVTIAQTVNTCRACADEGATGAHLHVRDDSGRHSLDGDRYQRLLDQLDSALPGFFAQITSETAGLYSDQDQRDLIHALCPSSISVALREFVPNDESLPAAHDCYHWAHENGVGIQHICYSSAELDRLHGLIADNVIPGYHHQIQLVLGSYDGTKISRVADVATFAAPLITPTDGNYYEWALCAFGAAETDCLVEALSLGGTARIGFENSLMHRDGTFAVDNAARVRELVANLPAIFKLNTGQA